MATKFITVTIEIMHDPDLNQSQKFLLAEIEQLNTLDKGCIASNNHFSELIGITKENVSKNLSSLVKMGYITMKTRKGSRNHERTIHVIDGRVPLIKVVRPPYQSSKTPLSKRQETKENKTINKTKRETKEDSLSQKKLLEDEKLYKKFLTELNTKVSIKSFAKDKSLKGLEDFLRVHNKQQLVDDYIKHQLDKGSSCKYIFQFLESYADYVIADKSREGVTQSGHQLF